jgi:hypothetical protein
MTLSKKDIVPGTNIAVDASRAYIPSSKPIRTETSKDYKYCISIEAINAKRHKIEPKNGAVVDGLGGLVLNGINQYAQTHNPNSDGIDGAATIRVDFLLKDLAENVTLIGNDPVNEWFIGLDKDGGASISRIVFKLKTNYYYWPFTPAENTKYRLVMTRSSGVIRMYINESEIASSVVDTARISGSTGPISIGHTIGGSDYLHGIIYAAQIDRSIARDPSSEPFPVDFYTLFSPDFSGRAGTSRILDQAVGGGVPIIADSSGNEFDMEQLNTTIQPLYQANPVNIRFDGVDDVSSVNCFDVCVKQPFTTYICAKINTSGTEHQTFFGDVNVNLAINEFGNIVAKAGSSISDTNDNRDEYKLIAAQFAGADSKIYVDGIEVASGVLGLDDVNELYLGAVPIVDNSPAVNLKAMYIQHDLYVSELNNVLMRKYGLI